jgi:deazaflavin-dependent oxidoreductase (nitroreductase family)
MSGDEWAQRKRGQVPSDIQTFNRKLIEEFRANKGRLSGPLAGSSLLLLTTTGARSGNEQTVVVGYRMDAEHYLVIASANGAPTHPAWYHNLQAHPIATVEVGPDTFKARARVASPDERQRLKSLIPYLEQQQTLTTREIPIVILSREG